MSIKKKLINDGIIIITFILIKKEVIDEISNLSSLLSYLGFY